MGETKKNKTFNFFMKGENLRGTFLLFPERET